MKKTVLSKHIPFLLILFLGLYGAEYASVFDLIQTFHTFLFLLGALLA